MRSNQIHQGRHRLGMESGVHVILIPEVALALADHRRNWFTTLLSPARHSFASMRKRTAVAQWSPAVAG
ncbi:hypothetical protein HQ346_08085 [Rhodococcus sp. BP-252]|uniref:Uncharacterized protein n=1 Tax=Rhodococcoides kyotonense TaxID=398843 RepID=A0A177YQC1_9NOCA|nr:MULTISPECIES: hypothetical protein [Rhodococcus]MBY6411258.1 hypothetical protein [Rhodococcus sp. BP-320]MBY6415917.1 hypothetical protein [Rhodococcus sp. BP-321]MBY6420574.1 hypothetical protein [Rhodococcus sp. BP-324]MBY6426124.1 hypothetical protein [Rhodococcus sp. BP-323]MBY6431335.1 hypothetical protein [Rhodococcus sp. BP-322]